MTKLEELHIRFRAKLPDRLQQLRALTEGAEADPLAAIRASHKLAGTAGSFGLTEVAQHAKRLERILAGESASRTGEIAAAFASLEEAIADLKRPSRSSRDSVPRVAVLGTGNVLLECATLLERHLIAIQAIDELYLQGSPSMSHFDAIVMDASSEFGPGETWVKEAMLNTSRVRRLHGGANLPVLLLVRDSTIETRVAAAHAGADMLVPVPLSAAGLMDALHAVTSKRRLRSATVLAIDDDPMALEFIAANLAEHGFETVTLQEPKNVIDTIRAVTPSALILDYDMPEYNGLEICASVRLSREHNHIPIIFVTNRIDRAARRAAFVAGCDDYLPKSDITSELGARLTARINRTLGLRAAAESDSLTGLPLRRVFIPTLDSRISEAVRRKETLSVCLLDIDMFKKINDTHGHQVGDRVLAELGELISHRFRLEDMRCRWGGEEVALAFPNENAETIGRVVTTLLTEFSDKEFESEVGNFHVTFSAGVAELGVDGGTFDELMAAADRFLYMAKEQGRARVFHQAFR